MIRLTVRAFSELVHLPAYAQIRILNDQKYPRSEPQIFRIPYYQVSLRGIRAFYRSGCERSELSRARALANQLNPAHKRIKMPCLQDFENSAQSRRQLQLQTIRTLSAHPTSDIELRVQFDIEAIDNKLNKFIIYNFRTNPLQPIVAQTSIQMAYWVMRENNIDLPITCIEYIDLSNRHTYIEKRQSKRILAIMRANARIVSTLWPTI